MIKLFVWFGRKAIEATESVEFKHKGDFMPEFDAYGMHETITKEMSKIYREKNADYGDSFHKSVDKHGLIAAVVRLDDKMQRIDNIVKTEKVEVKTESLEDTLLDMANYAIMTVIELRRKAWK